MKKIFDLEEEHIEIINKVKSEHPEIKTEVAALKYIILRYKDNEDIENRIAEKVSDRLLQDTQSLKYASKASEQNTQVLLDGLNTLLYKWNVEYPILTDIQEHPLIQDSKNNLKKKITHAKQKKDSRNARKQIM